MGNLLQELCVQENAKFQIELLINHFVFGEGHMSGSDDKTNHLFSGSKEKP